MTRRSTSSALHSAPAETIIARSDKSTGPDELRRRRSSVEFIVPEGGFHQPVVTPLEQLSLHPFFQLVREVERLEARPLPARRHILHTRGSYVFLVAVLLVPPEQPNEEATDRLHEDGQRHKQLGSDPATHARRLAEVVQQQHREETVQGEPDESQQHPLANALRYVGHPQVPRRHGRLRCALLSPRSAVEDNVDVEQPNEHQPDAELCPARQNHHRLEEGARYMVDEEQWRHMANQQGHVVLRETDAKTIIHDSIYLFKEHQLIQITPELIGSTDKYSNY